MICNDNEKPAEIKVHIEAFSNAQNVSRLKIRNSTKFHVSSLQFRVIVKRNISTKLFIEYILLNYVLKYVYSSYRSNRKQFPIYVLHRFGINIFIAYDINGELFRK